ncbi:MAG TPA: phosphatidylglycerophosphatase A [Candidatus Paceibacterota bacterium]|nr:phosphatidylglycerophosphatase A [Candidatus Paceibacterota bacterium]
MKKQISFSTFLATWFMSGLLKPIPPFKAMAGTYGSFLALPLCYLGLIYSENLFFNTTPTDAGKFVLYMALVVMVYFFGMLTVPIAEDELGEQIDWKGKIKTRDQNQIVIDEVLGMLISCIPILFVPRKLEYFLFAFVLFRIFDIVKIPPTRYFDKIKSAFGVMMDDVIAGIYAAASLWFLIKYLL